jgi:hypothetical protein
MPKPATAIAATRRTTPALPRTLAAPAPHPNPLRRIRPAATRTRPALSPLCFPLRWRRSIGMAADPATLSAPTAPGLLLRAFRLSPANGEDAVRPIILGWHQDNAS